jgi:hypothetical protein
LRPRLERSQMSFRHVLGSHRAAEIQHYEPLSAAESGPK